MCEISDLIKILLKLKAQETIRRLEKHVIELKKEDKEALELLFYKNYEMTGIGAYDYKIIEKFDQKISREVQVLIRHSIEVIEISYLKKKDEG